MGARQKLNGFFISGSLLAAGILGVCAHSWGVFLLSLLILLMVSMVDGEIRAAPEHASRRRHRHP